MFQLTMIPMICGGLMLVGSMPVYLLSDFLLGKFAGTYVTETFSLILAAAAGTVVYFYAMKKTGGMDSSDFSLILPAHLRKKLKL